MIALDSGDKIRGDATAATVVDFTIHGTDANAIKQLADGQLASGIGDLYTADSVDVVTSIILVNTDSSARAVNLYLTPSGGTARRLIPKDLSLGIGYCLITDGKTIGVYDASGKVLTLGSVASIGDVSDVTITAGDDHDMLYYDSGTSDWIDGTPAEILAQLSGQAAADFNMPNNQAITFGDAGEKVEGDGTDLTITSSNLLNLSAATDIIIPVNVGLKFGDGGEHIETNNTDFTITSGGELNLTANSDVVIPVNIGLHLGDGAEKLESDNTDLTINSGGDIALTATDDINIPVNVGLEFAGTEKIEGDGTDLNITVGATGDINIGADIGITFGDDGEKIEGDGTNLTIASSALLNLSASSDVVIPVNIGLHLGDGDEKLESNNTDLTINSGGDIALTATSNVNIPSGVGVTFGDDGEIISGDGTDLTIASSGVMNINATGGVLLGNPMTLAEDASIVLDAVLTGDTNWCGITQAGTAGAQLVFGDLVYLESTGKWLLAKADTAANCSGMLGMVILAAGADTNPTAVLLYGKIRAATLPGLTVGEPVYVSEDDAGDVEDAIPAGSGEIVRIVGYGATAEDLFFCPDNTYIELA